MQKLSIQKFSLLGLVLMAASAVTAAVLPSDTKTDNLMAANGSLTASTTLAQDTCTPTAGIDSGACNDTAVGGTGLSGTTQANGTKSDATSGNDPILP